jgi:hypothetical protein
VPDSVSFSAHFSRLVSCLLGLVNLLGLFLTSPAAVVSSYHLYISPALLYFVPYLVNDAMASSAFILLSSDGPKTVLDNLPERLVSDNYNMRVSEGVLIARMPACNEYVLPLLLSLSFSLFLTFSLMPKAKRSTQKKSIL